jgi:hypothetical protein
MNEVSDFARSNCKSRYKLSVERMIGLCRPAAHLDCNHAPLHNDKLQFP